MGNINRQNESGRIGFQRFEQHRRKERLFQSYFEAPEYQLKKLISQCYFCLINLSIIIVSLKVLILTFQKLTISPVVKSQLPVTIFVIYQFKCQSQNYIGSLQNTQILPRDGLGFDK